MMTEIWKDVEGWEDRYMVSNTGKVYSKLTNSIRKTAYTNDGHEVIMLFKDNKKFGTFVHRLVAKAFIPNPYNLPVVNHKDENPHNNHVDNLEWCTYQYNAMYNDAYIKRGQNMAYKVYQYDKDGNLVGVHDSCREAAKACGIKSNSNICDCCNNNRIHTVKGYVFSYKELSKDEVFARFKKSLIPNVDERLYTIISKKVAQYDLNMNLIATFPSTHEASRQLKIAASYIASVCRGEKTKAKGFIFKYI